MKVKITYTPEQENAAQATLDALRGILLYASRLYSRQERRKSQEGQQ